MAALRIYLVFLFLLCLPGGATAGTLVWLVHSSHTGGHRSAAKALSKALAELPGVETEVINTMDYLPKSLRNLQRAGFSMVTKLFPGIKRKAFESSIEGKEAAVSQASRWLAVKAYFSRSFLRRINEEHPDIIVSTHSQTNVMLGIWKKHGKITVPLHCVVTDYNTHAMWAHPWVDRYYVASEFVKSRLHHYGVDENRILVTGIPVSPSFARVPLCEASKARRLLSLDPDLPTIVMMGGSLGYGPYTEVVQALEALQQPVQFLAMTGKNQATKDELDRMMPGLKFVNLYTYGFVDKMFRYMDAADAVITKPGGLTVSELLCRRKAMIIINPAQGLEAHVATAIEALGVSETARDPQAGAVLALREATDPELQELRLIAVDEAAHPRAVFTIAGDVVDSATR